MYDNGTPFLALKASSAYYPLVDLIVVTLRPVKIIVTILRAKSSSSATNTTLLASIFKIIFGYKEYNVLSYIDF
jgi:hypothetical protein